MKATLATPGLVAIPIEEYERLKKRDFELRALEAAGVDNWEGYRIPLLREEEPDA
jgi:hypothetical protein